MHPRPKGFQRRRHLRFSDVADKMNTGESSHGSLAVDLTVASAVIMTASSKSVLNRRASDPGPGNIASSPEGSGIAAFIDAGTHALDPLPPRHLGVGHE